MRTSLLGVLFGATLLATPALAQLKPTQVAPCPANEISHGSTPSYCEDRTYSLPATDLLKIDAGLLGGISIIGTDAKTIEVRARVQVSGQTEEAKRRNDAIQIGMKDGWLLVTSSADDSYSVSYEVHVPHAQAVELRAQNGGIALRNVDGRAHFITSNGGVALTGVNGDISGQTSNGGVSVKLTGKKWTGKGLDITTTNGGISWEIPDSYAATITSSTVHGGVKNDFAATTGNSTVTTASHGSAKTVSLTLQKGGAPLRVVTTNGGITVKKS